MTQYSISDDQCSEIISADDMDDAKIKAKDWCREGDWGEDGARIDLRIENIDDPDEYDDITVEIEPNHAMLISAAAGDNPICGDEPDDHDWTREGEGGCDQNPGVWSTGGTSFTFQSHCRRCGLHRTVVDTGCQYNPGEHDTVEYRMLDDAKIAALAD